jgi:hypothetical protein
MSCRDIPSSVIQISGVYDPIKHFINVVLPAPLLPTMELDFTNVSVFTFRSEHERPSKAARIAKSPPFRFSAAASATFFLLWLDPFSANLFFLHHGKPPKGDRWA